MFLFNINHDTDPISFPDHPFFHFPSPFDDDAFFQPPQNDFFLHHQPANETPSTLIHMVDSDSHRINNNGEDDHTNQMKQQIQRKKGSSKRDRHSKINTLRGPRDRRMRLSLQVAREFFALQDRLGVDKPSKTMEWLLFHSRHAIKKLSRKPGSDARSGSSISDSEVVSGIDETIVNNSNKQEGRTKEKRGKVTRKTTHQPLAKETREKARARARARTREKHLQISQKLLVLNNEATKQEGSKLSSSWSTQIETGEESAGIQIEDQPISSQPRPEQLGNQRMFDDQDDSLMIIGHWSPSNSIYPSLETNDGIHQEQPFADIQFFGKPWEAYNKHGIS